MNFAQMLLMPVMSLETRWRASKESNRARTPVPKVKVIIEGLKGNDLRIARAQLRYREAMGTEWLKTREIERRLGMNRSTAYKNLDKWFAQGIVEKRDVLPKTASSGHEWKWVESEIQPE